MANELVRSKRVVIDKKFEDGISEENLRYLEKYEMDMQIRELSEKTIYNYKRDLIQWMSYLNKNQFNCSVKEVTDDDLEEFIFFCKKQGNNTERIKRRFSSISAFYIYLRKKKIIKENPLEFIDRPKKGRPVVTQTFLTQKQVDEIRANLKEKNNLQLTTYFEFSLCTMARVTAISNVTWDQIDFDNYVVNDVLEKEGKIVTLYFDDKISDLLKQLKKDREVNGMESEYVFITRETKDNNYRRATDSAMRYWTKQIGAFINIPTLHPHDFRHSGATLRKNAGISLEMISSLLNHNGTDVTKKYYLKEDKSKMSEEFRKVSI